MSQATDKGGPSLWNVNSAEGEHANADIIENKKIPVIKTIIQIISTNAKSSKCMFAFNKRFGYNNQSVYLPFSTSQKAVTPVSDLLVNTQQHYSWIIKTTQIKALDPNRNHKLKISIFIGHQHNRKRCFDVQLQSKSGCQTPERGSRACSCNRGFR